MQKFAKQILIVAIILPNHIYCQNLYFHLEKEDTSFTDDVQPIFNETTHSQTSCFMGCLNHQHCCYAQLKKNKSFGDWFCSLFTHVDTDEISKAKTEMESNIFSVVDERKKTCIPKDCWMWYKLGFHSDGVYTINANGVMVTQVFCDMSTHGGGWTVIQRRFNGEVDFHRTWEEYKNGFGNIKREYWLGNELIHQLTKSTGEDTLIKIEGSDIDNITKHIIQKGFRVESENQNYKLESGEGQLQEGESDLAYDFNVHNQMGFTTKDNDNDNKGSNCANSYGGGWWWESCIECNPNGNYYSSGVCPYAAGINWYHWTGFYKSLTKIKMSIKHPH